MASTQRPKMTQAELLEQLSPPPFNQRKAVPPEAVLEYSPEERWWRSDSPRADPYPDVPPESGSGLSATQGVLGAGLRSGPGNFVTTGQTGPISAAHVKEDGTAPRTIPGYGGHIAGKIAGNCIGTTYEKSNQDAIEHLKTTSQVIKYPTLAAGLK
mmetsp:Transcript_44962/g.96937  ORF Transcript_44962/g.96937 Transcript_44962/m.96937 type:complete len:156 (+) Transcript_44962:252-719(+)|eukprot:CAMPEP_0206478552 /NCGR_PEP_ID=MMETSP0324_2-20121206/36120_1 /ASSEMBLY_ACC=CAM_ASM_000836 /TAXON_ID=2866 /ORGANISM="Crypthecodinium cohnii, Strain Seligo" /LENGTH=155 /DNA_ID=CAMNT_0053954877 /DNA_START=233 /DNA_END=700 /DNA_ORIENTATION=-